MARTGYLTPTATEKTVGATSVKVCDALPASTGISYRLLQNISDADIYLGLGKAAEMSKGIMLPKDGGMYEMYVAKGNFYPGEIHAVSSEAGKTLLFLQG